MSICFDTEVCQNIKEALAREWLETNGLGGYASSTILNCHTRRYHGLLVANLEEPAGRYVLLSRIEESLFAEDKEFFISCNRYPGVFHPHGHQYMQEFRSDECPHFIYQIGDTRIHKSIMLVHGQNTALVQYDVEENETPFTLRLRPLLAFRGYHTLTSENLALQARTFPVKNGFKIQPYNALPPLFVRTSAAPKFHPSPVWYRNLEYLVEQERRFDCHEDLFQPGVLEIPMRKGSVVTLAASLAEIKGSLSEMWAEEKTRRAFLTRKEATVVRNWTNPQDKEAARLLIESGRQFLVNTPTGRPSIIAGYHWFEEYSRDTMISLPGLTFCSGRVKEGAVILAEIGKFEKNGLLPTFFTPDDKDLGYNCADAPLWYFWAVQQMRKYGGSANFIKTHIWPVMKRILRGYMNGTMFNIGMDANGLVRAGTAATQLTWMDAMVRGVPVTPRNGYAVDINALWYNALCFADQLAKEFEDPGFMIGDLPAQVAESFRRTFRIQEDGYLGDASGNGCLDVAVRPNQILAVSLPFSPLDSTQWTGVVDRVREELLTPFGLRTLSPRNPAYKGRYEGDSEARDSSYHQGTVWPWLLGHFGEAYLKTAGATPAAKKFLLETIRPLITRHLETYGVGCVAEIFGGDPPHDPNGCIAQAWSTGELIRLLDLVKDIDGASRKAVRRMKQRG